MLHPDLGLRSALDLWDHPLNQHQWRNSPDVKVMKLMVIKVSTRHLVSVYHSLGVLGCLIFPIKSFCHWTFTVSCPPKRSTNFISMEGAQLQVLHICCIVNQIVTETVSRSVFVAHLASQHCLFIIFSDEMLTLVHFPSLLICVVFVFVSHLYLFSCRAH